MVGDDATKFHDPVVVHDAYDNAFDDDIEKMFERHVPDGEYTADEFSLDYDYSDIPPHEMMIIWKPMVKRKARKKENLNKYCSIHNVFI